MAFVRTLSSCGKQSKIFTLFQNHNSDGVPLRAEATGSLYRLKTSERCEDCCEELEDTHENREKGVCALKIEEESVTQVGIGVITVG